MSVLKSRYHGKSWNDKEVITLPIDELWASVPKADKHKGKAFYQPVLEDIKENGLHFPLLIVEATHKQLIAEKVRYKHKMVELPFNAKNTDLDKKIYVVWGGSNRVRIAKELGYEYVDCVLYSDGSFDEARSHQKLHREPYKGKYY